MSTQTRAYLQVHFCVILWGFTAIFGKLITLDALALVWWRMLIVVAALLLLPRVQRQLRAMSWRLIGSYAAIGLLVAMHWLLFYSAVKLANASVAAICLAVAPLFLAILEPRIAGRPFNPRELLLGIGVIPGVAMIVGGIPSGMYVGLAVGLASAVFVAAFSACNKRMIERAGPLAVTCIELGSGTVFLTVLAPILPHTGAALPLPDLHDALLLLLMSLGCTLLPFALVLKAMRHVSAFGTQIANNLEPVYAIILAIAILGEQHEVGLLFYAGVVVVIAAVVVHPLISRRPPRKPPKDVLGVAEAHNVAE
ncbi:MAG TPA: DMT family transporter [Rhodanobacteraceae bacterium]